MVDYNKNQEMEKNEHTQSMVSQIQENMHLTFIDRENMEV